MGGGAFEESGEGSGGPVVRAVAQKNRVLSDRLIETVRRGPARAAGNACKLGVGDEAELCCASDHELIGLGDILPHDDFAAQPVIKPELLQNLKRGGAIGGGFGIAHGQPVEASCKQNGRRLFRIGGGADQVRVGAVQGDFADGVGKARAGDGQPVAFSPFWTFLIGGEIEVERRAVQDLRVKLAGGGENKHRPVAGPPLEAGGDFLRRPGEIGGDCDFRLARLRAIRETSRRPRRQQQNHPQQGANPHHQTSLRRRAPSGSRSVRRGFPRRQRWPAPVRSVRLR